MNNTEISQKSADCVKYLGRFLPSFIPQGNCEKPAMWFIFYGKEILLKSTDGILTVPLETDFNNLSINLSKKRYVGEFDSTPCYCMETPTIESPSTDMSFGAIRSLSARPDSGELFKIAGFAYHLMNWERMSTFCGRCGSPMQDKQDELAKVCAKCGCTVYPRISPATITAVLKGDEILLAHNRSFKDGFYGLVAGFVEPGETLEDCVRREIMEETGICVKNLRYYGSQPWPFPDSLMMAYTAEYDSGEVKADGMELMDARWFRFDSLPLIPGPDSIAGRMIRWYCSTHQS